MFFALDTRPYQRIMSRTSEKPWLGEHCGRLSYEILEIVDFMGHMRYSNKYVNERKVWNKDESGVLVQEFVWALFGTHFLLVLFSSK